ncbi:MAG: PAS domain S-box protein [Thermodesulfobacteriota bacterium]|nr:PAS domain S-box protein [Thermodesulfobacteriota bacterium]
MKRIDRIIETVRKAINGDFSFRIETSGKNDDIDRLANVINQLVEIVSKHIANKEHTEAVLRDSKERYRRLKANIPGMVYRFAMEPNGTFSFPYVNDASKQLFDISPDDLMRDVTLITKLIHPDDRERFESSVKYSAETLRPWRAVLRHIVNGRVRWYDCMSRPERQPNGDILWDGIILEITDRVKAEESLKKSQEELSNIIAVSPVGIAIYDSNGQCISINDSLAHIIGVTKQQLLEQNYNKIESWKKTGMVDLARKAIRTQSAQRHEIITISSFGKEVFLDCHLVPFGDKGLLLMIQDITERKQVENTLRKTLSSLTKSQKLAKVGSWDWDFKTGEVEWSDEVYRLFGLDPDKFHPQIDSIMSRFHPEDRKLYDSLVTQAIENHEQYSFEARIILPDGNNRILFSTSEGHFDDNGNLIELAGTVQDITERKRAEEELLRAKAYSEYLLETANAMIIVLDADGKVQVLNRAAEETTGYTRKELLGHNWFELLVPKDKYPEVRNAFQKSADEELPTSFENPILTKSGEERFISWRNTELLENDIFAGSISYGIDITRHKELERQLLQSQKMEAIGQLTGGIAHDFNNMLSVILGHAELLKTSFPPEDPLLKSVLEIENAGLHSRDIIRQLLAFSRKEIIAPKTSNLNRLIENIKKTLTKLIGENINLRFFPQQDLWNVRIDPAQIDQILFNLAANARDAMPEGGTLTIETSNVDLDEIYCTLHVECQPGQYVVLSLDDDGFGMDKETLSHVFEPFWTTKEVGKGTGLGLATVYGITRQNGGFVTAYSEPGKGATFRIHIPRIMDEIQKEGVVRIAPLEFHPATVLLVEDDDMVRGMTAALLKKVGYSVLLAESPMEALAIYEKETSPIDLLITDVVMPQMSGAELVSKIKKIKPEVKVLFMSGYTENIIVRQGVLKENVHFIQKPFIMNDFARKVREAIDER